MRAHNYMTKGRLIAVGVVIVVLIYLGKSGSGDLDYTISETPKPTAPEHIYDGPRLPRRPYHVIIHVFCWKRLASLQRLMDSLLASHYGGHDLTLVFNVEGEPGEDVVQYVNGFNWPYGIKRIKQNKERKGLEKTIISAWDPQSMSEYAVFLEDDIEVSPYWYIWVFMGLDKYVLNPRSKDENMIGISLYTPRLNQIAYPFVKWLPDREMPDHQPFLFQLPCSWGALYFPRQWREFRDFYDMRTQPEYSEMVPIPDARSNKWSRSWKKYLIEQMYVRGTYMLYPNFPNQEAFSTNHLEVGEHTGEGGKAEGPSAKLNKKSKQLAELYTVPLLTDISYLRELVLKDTKEMPVIDLHHKRRTQSEIIEEGAAFLASVRAASPDYQELANIWGSQ
eukprot:Colp12_sorted_trinity150504_noHs@33733